MDGEFPTVTLLYAFINSDFDTSGVTPWKCLFPLSASEMLLDAPSSIDGDPQYIIEGVAAGGSKRLPIGRRRWHVNTKRVARRIACAKHLAGSAACAFAGEQKCTTLMHDPSLDHRLQLLLV
jgi:hypothetical protein